ATAAVGQAERGVVGGQRVVDGLHEPGVVAELEGVLAVAREGREEGAEAIHVAMELGRQLPENRAEGRAEGAGALEEAAERLVWLAQALEVRDEAVPLDGEQEARRRLLGPGGEVVTLVQAVERGVDLDSVEVLTVEVEPARRGQVARIEDAAPVLVVPAGCADPQRRHRHRLPHPSTRQTPVRSTSLL